MKEVWKDVTGYEGLYQVSNTGKVLSIRRGLILKPRIKNNGYQEVVLQNGSPKYITVHKLVAIHFVPNPDSLNEIHHLDENKENNKHTNLIWIDHFDHMKITKGLFRTGEEFTTAVLNDTIVKEIKRLRKETGEGYVNIARKLGIENNKDAVGNVIRGKTWMHIK